MNQSYFTHVSQSRYQQTLFQIGKVRIKQEHRDFIDEWINYDASISNPKDDCLDSVEIALRAAGALLPGMPDEAVLISAGPVEVNESVEPAGAHAIDGVAEKFVIDGSGFTFTDTVAVVEHPLFAPPELSVAVTT